ncbi:MAG: hypothetical protein QM594_03065 [Niabella sp.]
MKKQLFCTFLCIYTLLFVACSKNDHETGNNSDYKPSKRPIGETIGSAEQFTFGSAYSSFSSQNGEIRIDIPAQTIDGTGILTIQKIKNTSPGGVGDAFRISFDKQLSKPVTVQFSYEDKLDSLSGNVECTGGIAIQDTVAGFWALQTKVAFATGGNYVSYNTTAKKFDMAFTQPVRLTPAFKTVRPLTDVRFSVVSNMPVSDPLCSLYGTDRSPILLCDDVLAESTIIDRWELLNRESEGAGALTPNGSQAIYKTSAYEHPVINPATILVFLKHYTRPLSAKVFVQPEVSGLKFSIGNRQYSFNDDVIEAGLVHGKFEMSWDLGAHSGSLTSRGGSPGTYNWDNNFTQFLFVPGDMTPQQAFQHLYNDGLIVSAGQVKITQVGTVGQKITGTLEISNAGSTNLETSAYLGDRKIVGSFNVMRDY